jgi:hypothetical protein
MIVLPTNKEYIMNLSISHLTAGDKVTLEFSEECQGAGHAYREAATFVGIDGAGKSRLATFTTLDENGNEYEWEAYRYDGAWRYGSAADALYLVSIDND